MTHYIDVMERPRFKKVYELMKEQPRIKTVKRINLRSFYDQFDFIKRAGYPVIVTDFNILLHVFKQNNVRTFRIIADKFLVRRLKSRLHEQSPPSRT